MAPFCLENRLVLAVAKGGGQILLLSIIYFVKMEARKTPRPFNPPSCAFLKALELQLFIVYHPCEITHKHHKRWTPTLLVTAKCQTLSVTMHANPL